MTENLAAEAESSGGRRGRGERGGAAARRAARSGGGPGPQLTYIRRKIKIYEVLDEEGLALIEKNADTVLEEIGIIFRDDPEALMSVARKRKLDEARWSLASPTQDNVRGVAGVLGVRYRQLADGEFNHTSALVLLDRDGRIVARTEQIGSQVDPEFVAEVRRVLAN